MVPSMYNLANFLAPFRGPHFWHLAGPVYGIICLAWAILSCSF